MACLVEICEDSRCFSTAVLYEHVQWAAFYTRNFPALIKTLINLRQMAAKRTTDRYNSGSKAKDLFYYLVRFNVHGVRLYTDAASRVMKMAPRLNRLLVRRSCPTVFWL